MNMIQPTYPQEGKQLLYSCSFSLRDSAFVDKVVEEISEQHVLGWRARNVHLVPKTVNWKMYFSSESHQQSENDLLQKQMLLKTH